eukprot:Mycagemm_TRINITY_DN10262_c0_g1::TRINITY_DN10262_c0_g1_i1::g.3637::m.3637 type:complete len:106 gc:universal TRINITY_DN10262_c0_g1_i1:978-661(-)
MARWLSFSLVFTSAIGARRTSAGLASKSFAMQAKSSRSGPRVSTRMYLSPTWSASSFITRVSATFRRRARTATVAEQTPMSLITSASKSVPFTSLSHVREGMVPL